MAHQRKFPIPTPLFYGLIGAFTVPLFGYLALIGSSHETEWFRYLIPMMVGSIAGALIGLQKNKQDRLLESQRLEVAERITTEKQLHKTLAEFNAVMENVDYGIVFMDSNLKASIVNKAFRKMWGVSEEFVANNPTMRDLMNFNRYNQKYLVSDDDFERYLDEREAQVRQGSIDPVEMKTADGMTLRYQCVALPGGGRMLTYFDITEVKEAEEKLAHSEKMEAIGIMASGVAHDLNNILSGLVSYPELVLMKLDSNSELRKPVTAIQESGKRAAEVVSDLLTVARGSASTREVASLNRIISEYLFSPEGLSLKFLFPNVQIITDLDKNLHNITCSTVHVKKCLMNLITNATEAIQGRGTVNIITRNQSISYKDSIHPKLSPGQYVVASVIDSGGGIEEQDIAKIFEPFYTKKMLGRSGTGLGLTIVWNTMQEHDGGVTVSSDADNTTFQLFFPATQDEAVTSPPNIEYHQFKGDGQQILVVDDEAQQREIATQMLTALNYHVYTVASGEAAVNFVRQKPVDLLLLDMIMGPGMNGRETYQTILQMYPKQRSVIASGFSENEEVEKALGLGASKFINKPYSMIQLGQALQQALQ